MKKMHFLLLCAAMLSVSATAKSDSDNVAALPAGAIHHFDFSGDLRDRVTGRPLYITRRDKSDVKQIGIKQLTAADVTFVDTDEGPRTAIRILPMEFAGKLNYVDAPQLTATFLLRFDEKDFQQGKHNSIDWMNAMCFDPSGARSTNVKETGDPRYARVHHLRRMSGEYHKDGTIDASGLANGLRIRQNEWVRLTISLDEKAGKRTIYMADRISHEECKPPLDSMVHANRVGLFQELAPYAIVGEVSDVAIYDRILTEEEVAQLHGVASFDEYSIIEAAYPLLSVLALLTVIPLAFCIWRPWRLQRIEEGLSARGDNETAREEVDRALESWWENVGETASPRNIAASKLEFRYPRALTTLSVRKHIKRAIDARPSDSNVIRRINRTIDAYNAAIRYRFNGSVIYILAVIAATVFTVWQSMIDTTDTITVWILLKRTIISHGPILLMLVPYIAFSMGWALIGRFDKSIDELRPNHEKEGFRARIREKVQAGAGFGGILLAIVAAAAGWCGAVVMDGINRSTQLVSHFRNGGSVVTGTINPAMFMSGFVVIGIAAILIYLAIILASVAVAYSAIVVIPYKIIRNYILHR